MSPLAQKEITALLMKTCIYPGREHAAELLQVKDPESEFKHIME